MARVRLTGSAPWTRVLPILVRTIPLPHLFAAYGPVDYEILFLETEPSEVARLVELAGRASFSAAGMEARHGVAWYPRTDGPRTRCWRAATPLLRPSATGDGKNGHRRAEPSRRERRRNGTASRPREAGRRLEHQRADPGRDGRRQGRPGAGDSPLSPRTGPVRRAQLRRPGRDADRDASCSVTSKGAFTGAAPREGRPPRVGQRRDRLPRRDRRDAARTCRRSCCARSKRARSCPSARSSRGPSTCASSPRPTATSRPRSRRARFAAISSSA